MKPAKGFFEVAFEAENDGEVGKFSKSSAASRDAFFGLKEELPGAVFFFEVAVFKNEVLPIGEALREDFIGPVDQEAFTDFPVG